MNNKSVLVTGGSRGIGAELVKAFSKAGCDVIFFYKNSKDLATALAGQTGARAFCVDITDPAQVEKAFSTLRPVDVLVNNAGITSYGLLNDLTPEKLDELIDTNIKGAVYCSQAASRQMIKRGKGAIINISSIWGMTGASCEVAYSMTKAAIIGLTKALAKELAPSGVRVNCVAPGVIMTDMLDGFSSDALEDLKTQTPLGRLGTPADVVSAVAYLMSEEAGFITGQVLSPNGGFVI